MQCSLDMPQISSRVWIRPEDNIEKRFLFLFLHIGVISSVDLTMNIKIYYIIILFFGGNKCFIPNFWFLFLAFCNAICRALVIISFLLPAYDYISLVVNLKFRISGYEKVSNGGGVTKKLSFGKGADDYQATLARMCF